MLPFQDFSFHSVSMQRYGRYSLIRMLLSTASVIPVINLQWLPVSGWNASVLVLTSKTSDFADHNC